MAFFVGKAATITIAASARPYENFSLKFRSQIIPTDNFNGSGSETNEAGMFGADVAYAGPYDGAEGIAQGDSVSVIFGTGGSGPSFTIVNRIESIEIKTATNDVARIAVSGKSNGAFSVTI